MAEVNLAGGVHLGSGGRASGRLAPANKTLD